MKTKRAVSLYVHLPFCIRKCAYCDFYSGNFYEHAEMYLDALLKEAELYRTRYPELLVKTVYLGGGTPSSLSSDALSSLLERLFACFTVLPDAEVTMEANPATLTEEKLIALKKAGINRLSIGAQSCNDRELSVLGRLHGYDDFVKTYRLARQYFENISLDMMFGLPDQTVDSFSHSLEKILSLDPDHVSLYALKIEEGTPFYRMQDTLALPSDDAVCEMYLLANEKLSKVGYHQYEISNYAKQGSSSRHNLSYWYGEEYIGLGAAAHSCFDGVRYANYADIHAYIGALSKDEIPPHSEEYRLEKDDLLEEAIILPLRLTSGLDTDLLKERFGYDLLNERGDKIDVYLREGLMQWNDKRLSFTPRGFLVSNTILTELLP